MPLVRLFFSCCLVSAALFGADRWKIVSNPRQHFRISFPENWTIWTPGSDGGIGATSYSKDHGMEGGLTPSGEAGINVFPLRGQSWTLAQWANSKLSDEEEVRRRVVNLKPVRLNAPTPYLQSEWRYEAGPGRPFAAEIEFIEGDPRESIYRAILDRVVRSITATEPSQKK